jgi:hypothetical protein
MSADNGAPDSPTPSAPPTEESTVVRGFDLDSFIPWPAWQRTVRLLRSGHGSYGVAGPRGVGKTWLLRRSVSYARSEGGIGLWYPSPSDYDSISFLGSLSETFAEAVLDRRLRSSLLRAYGAVISVGLALYAGIGAGVLLRTVEGAGLITSVVGGVVAGLAAAITARWVWVLWRASTKAGRAELYARRVQENVRFALTRREGMEAAAQGANVVGIKLGLSRSRELRERPVTLSSLIHDFRLLAALAGDAVAPAPIVIAVDELDKLIDHEKVRQLLRDVKGVFGVENVHFLVSVSTEAARSLNLNGLTERNEFNSSFDVVVELPRVSVEGTIGLLTARGWKGGPDSAGALAVLGGGVPREVVRLAEYVSNSLGPTGITDTSLVVIAAVGAETQEFRRLVVTAPTRGVNPVGQDTRVGVYTALSDDMFGSVDAFAKRVQQLWSNAWDPDWRDRRWDDDHREEWRRLLVRLIVAWALILAPLADGANDALLRVISVSSDSAIVARLMYEEGAYVTLLPKPTLM